MELAILGIGSVSAVGNGSAALREALEGERAPRIEPSAPADLAETTLDSLEYVTDAGELERFVSRRSLRRLDKFTQTALLASFLAVEDAGLSIDDRSRVGIALGTAYGPLETTFRYQDTIIADGDAGASPTLFANSVHSALASTISISMKITGPCLTVTTFERTAAEVFRTAGLWLREGRVDYVLAGVGDETCPVLHQALQQLEVRGDGPLDPLQLDRCSYTPGQGFVVLLLGPAPVATQGPRIERIVSAALPDQIDAELLADHGAIFLSANGNRHTGRLYAHVGRSNVPVAAYASLYGSLPVGLGFDLALAAVCCRSGWLYPCPGARASASLNVLTERVPLETEERIGCLACTPRQTTLISVARS
jgi:3-oxoacyl-[acyl-carrier-protein] synthase II